MPEKLLSSYIRELPKLLAEQELSMSNAVALGSTPQSKEHQESQRKALARLERVARGGNMGQRVIKPRQDVPGLSYEVWKPETEENVS